jgi:AGZA family xanthine/uracil permease-like MFS transporter
LCRGLFTYTVINGSIWIVVKLSGETIVPENYEMKQYWSWRPPGERPWIVRAVFRLIYWAKHRKDRAASFSLNSGDDMGLAEQYPSDRASKAATDVKDTPRPPSPEPFRRVY